MENVKYIAFYVLLLIIAVLGFLQYHWLLIVPAALVLTIAYIFVKGDSWRQVMGKGNMNGGVVFIGTFISQLVTAGLFYGIGRLVAMLFN